MQGKSYTPRGRKKKNKKKKVIAKPVYEERNVEPQETWVIPNFDFGELPIEICIEVIKKFGPQETLEFAGMEEYMKNLVEKAKLKAAYFNVAIEDKCGILVSLDKTEEEEFYPEPNRISMTTDKHLEVIFSKFGRVNENLGWYADETCCRRFGVLMWKRAGSYVLPEMCYFHPYLHMLFGLYSGPMNIIKVHTNYVNLDLFRQEPRLHKCKSLMILGGEILNVRAAELLDIVTVEERLYVCAHLVHEKMFNVPRLMHCHQAPLERSDWKKFNNEIVRINTRLYDGEGFWDFLREWKNGKKPKLRVLSIIDYYFQGFLNFDDDTVEEFNFFQYDSEKRDPTYILPRKNDPTQLYRLDCRKGFDVENVNGVLGTLLMDMHAIHFFVWHDRRPERSVIGKKGLKFHKSSEFLHFQEVRNWRYMW